MPDRYKLAFLKNSELVERAENKILEMIDDAYRKGELITQPDIERVLSAAPYNFSHGFVCKKLKQFQKDKKIRSWQANGVNHFELHPLIPKPVKLAIVASVFVIGLTTIIDVASFSLMDQQHTFMMESTIINQVQVFELYAIKCGLFVSTGIFLATFLQYVFGTFKETKNKKYLNNST